MYVGRCMVITRLAESCSPTGRSTTINYLYASAMTIDDVKESSCATGTFHGIRESRIGGDRLHPCDEVGRASLQNRTK